MKSGKPQKAPRIKSPNPKKPNVMKESDNLSTRKNPMAPMRSKKLSK